MILSRQFFVMAILFNAVCMGQVNPYIGGALGLSGSGYKSPYFDGNTGVDVNFHRFFAEAEGGADTANKRDTGNGFTVKAHSFFVLRVTRALSFGGGVRYSELTTSQYKKHDRWPVAEAMYERRWLRANVEYLAPGSDHRYHLTGGLLDLRIRLARGIYYRERVSAFVFRNPFEAHPSYHRGSDLDYGVIYVFKDRATTR
jgi:hypothetical protein